MPQSTPGLGHALVHLWNFAFVVEPPGVILELIRRHPVAGRPSCHSILGTTWELFGGHLEDILGPLWSDLGFILPGPVASGVL